MAITLGTKLGPYEIISPLGAGAMGEVYRARDTRLDRTVAIKILPPHFADDATRRQRFEREAKLISSLNHPHICILHDVGREDGVDYLVMECLEGESLAERLEKGRLPVSQALHFGSQIASALDKAHRNGVTHRDLKPGNIMLTNSGAKLLDFGLAKSGPPLAGGVTLPDAALTAPTVTMLGSIVGTVQYMAPEQVEGKEVDARSDIFSFGAILYEMVTGSRAFQGQNLFSVAAAVVEKEPKPIRTLQPLTPRALDRTIQVCLAKDPDQRWQSASDLGKELRWIAESSSAGEMPVGGAARRMLGARTAWLAAALLTAVVVAALLLALRAGRVPKPLAFRQLNPRGEAIFQAAFAGEEDTVIYSAADSGNTPQIFTVRPGNPEPQPLGPRGTHLLAVSSKRELAVLIDAHYVWFRLFTGTLARMPLDGGAPREILEGVRQADWSPDGSQLAIIREVGGRDRLEYPIGHVLREVSGFMSDVRFSPNGERIAYFEHPRKWDDRGSVNIIDLSGKNAVLSDGYWSARGLAWSPNGGEVFFSASQVGGSYLVYAVTLGGKRRIAYQSPGGLTIQDIGRKGRWLATRGDFRYASMVRLSGANQDRDLSWLSTSHVRSLSQDGTTLLFAETALGNNYEVCLRKTDGSPVLRLGDGWPADLSADGKWVLAVVQSHPPQLVIYPTGAGETRQLERGQIENYATARWFRDGKRLLINGNEPGKASRFFLQEIGGGPPRPVIPEGTRDGTLSSDEKLVLARGPERKYFVYPIAGGDPRPAPALTEADEIVLWSADGLSVLAYHRGEIPSRLERVDLATGARSLFRELVPSDRTGLLSLRDIFVTNDLRSYAYTAYYQVSYLFMSEASQ